MPLHAIITTTLTTSRMITAISGTGVGTKGGEVANRCLPIVVDTKGAIVVGSRSKGKRRS